MHKLLARHPEHSRPAALYRSNPECRRLRRQAHQVIRRVVELHLQHRHPAFAVAAHRAPSHSAHGSSSPRPSRAHLQAAAPPRFSAGTAPSPPSRPAGARLSRTRSRSAIVPGIPPTGIPPAPYPVPTGASGAPPLHAACAAVSKLQPLQPSAHSGSPLRCAGYPFWISAPASHLPQFAARGSLSSASGTSAFASRGLVPKGHVQFMSGSIRSGCVDGHEADPAGRPTGLDRAFLPDFFVSLCILVVFSSLRKGKK